MVDRVRPFKNERPAEGGTQTDEGFVEVDIGQDYLDCAGVTLQKPGASTSTSDSLVRAERTAAGALHLVDQVANGAAGLDLSQLLNSVLGTPGSHASTPDIIHWLGGEGPGDGYASGSYRSVTMTGICPSAIVWYASSASNAAKLYQVTIAYSGLVPTTVTQTLYQSGVAVRTVTDSLTYGSVFYPNISRSWS